MTKKETQKGERIMTKFKHLFAVVVVLAAVSIALMLVGCSSNPLQSSTVKQPNLLKRNLAVAKVADEPAFASKIMSAADGGVISLVDVELTFPPQALSNDTLVFIDIPDVAVFENHFGTDGLRFNVPVKVVMSYRNADLSGVNENSIRLAWFNDKTGEWNSMQCTLNTASKIVTGYLEHFSAYALISD